MVLGIAIVPATQLERTEICDHGRAPWWEVEPARGQLGVTPHHRMGTRPHGVGIMAHPDVELRVVGPLEYRSLDAELGDAYDSLNGVGGDPGPAGGEGGGSGRQRGL